MNKRQRILKRDKNLCQYCGTYVEDNGIDLHLDHKLPKSSGGDCSENNLVVSCCKCNMLKGCMSVDEFRDKMTKKINYHISEINKYLNYNLENIKEFKFYFE